MSVPEREISENELSGRCEITFRDEGKPHAG
jgi:hypothetical protein